MNAPVNIKPSLIGALARALPELESAKKNKANPAFKSKYADLLAVIEAIEPIRAHGLWFRQHAHENPDGAMIETFYIHESGEQLSAGTTFMPASKRDAQGFGSALSYCRRYGLQTAFGLATEDDDGNAAVKSRVTTAVSPRQDEPVITEEQYTKLMALIPAARLTPAQFNQTMGCPRVCDLPASKYAEAVERLETRMEELAKKETNAKAKENA